MTCDCKNFRPIELSREALAERIKQTARLLRRLEILKEHELSKNKLLKCNACGQYWQLGYAWSWGDRGYLLKIPSINVDNWMLELFERPDELTVYSASMQDYFDRNDLTEGNSKFRSENCAKNVIKYTVMCLDHHIISLQKSGVLPSKPKGRLLPEYSRISEAHPVR